MLVTAGMLVAFTLWTSRRAPPSLRTISWSGATQGTQYHLRITEPPANVAPEEWRRIVAVILDRIDRTFSRWRADSEISRINTTTNPIAHIEDVALANVTAFALRLAEQSGGAFDPTLAPLLRLWGFGPGPVGAAPPSDEALADARRRVGWRWLELRREADGWMMRRLNAVELDLDALAQGFTADAIADTLRAHGATNFMVEVGGEVVVSGHNAERRPWRIGIDLPLPDTRPGEQLAGVMHVTDCGMATSGGYRRRRAGGEPAIHIFDGRLGRPLTRERMSVTVVARDGLTADGLATAAFILGPDEGLAWLAKHWPDADALFLEVGPDGTVRETTTPGFAARTRYERLAGAPTPATR